MTTVFLALFLSIKLCGVGADRAVGREKKPRFFPPESARREIIYLSIEKRDICNVKSRVCVYTDYSS